MRNMAIVQFTAAVNAIRGKLNGSVFNKARTIPTLQGKQMPPKKRTVNQSAYRNIFAQVQGAWKTLTQAEQQSFADAAAIFPVRNRFGDLVHISGYNWFIRTNLLRLSVDLDLLREANNNAQGASGYDTWMHQLSVVENPDSNPSLHIRYVAQVSIPAIVGNRFIAYVSAPVSAGVTAFHGNWIVAGFGLVPGNSSVGTMHTFELNKFTAALGHTYRPGDYVFVRFLVVAPQNGATYQDEFFRVQLS